MEYLGIEYSLVLGVERGRWIWSLSSPHATQRTPLNSHPNAGHFGLADANQATGAVRRFDYRTRNHDPLKFITRNLTVMAKCIPIFDLSQQE
jgi:hypothetical protein